MPLRKQVLKVLGGVLASAMLTSVATATPISLGSITHDYGSDDGQVAPTSYALGGSSCDVLNTGSVTVQGASGGDCQRFADAFDFSGIAYDSIDHFTLSLAFSGADDQPFEVMGYALEHWEVRPASSVTNGSVQDGANLEDSGPQSFTFDDSLDVFGDILNGKSFYLWFSAWFPSSTDFTLDSATLELFGTSDELGQSGNATAVPGPGSLALFALGLFSLFWAYRVTTLREKDEENR